MASQQEQLIIPAHSKGSWRTGRGGVMVLVLVLVCMVVVVKVRAVNESSRKSLSLLTGLLFLVPAAGCHASVRIDADQLRDLRAPPLNYQTPL